ncbi:hypothetical protein K9L16_01755 [Candidatus Pacearchaeota archaeon]|nr:hypothetical protein [Candidatus Pacearchaeota archaeon]
MKIGIIGPSKLEEKNKFLIEKLAKIIAEKEHGVYLTPDKNSSSEYFVEKFLESGGKKVFLIIPLDDLEFGNSWVNKEIGENINCGTWRNQPEKLNEETEVLISIGYSVGGLAEIAYTKWFKPKPVYIITDFDKEKLPEKINNSLDLRYVSIKDLKEQL